MSYPEIIAQAGTTLLVQIDAERGRILDPSRGIYFAPFPLAAIFARGWWEDYTGDQAVLPTFIQQCSEIEPDTSPSPATTA